MRLNQGQKLFLNLMTAWLPVYKNASGGGPGVSC